MMKPRGFYFSPLDHEVIYHLQNKASDHNYNLDPDCIQDQDFYSLNPDQISLKKNRNGTSSKAYFFTYLRRKDGDGEPDRSTGDGYWEEIGGEVAIIEGGIVGYKRTFVFRFLSADEGKDNFYMNEFRLNPSVRSDDPNMRNNIKNLVVCKVERMSPHCFLVPQVQWVEGANECSDDEVEEKKINTSPEAV